MIQPAFSKNSCLMAHLILKCRLFPEGRVVLDDSEMPVTVGRSQRADIVIDDSLLSRIHAEFRVSPNGRFQIVDNDSTNLTIVNDQDVESAELKSGDRILLGDTEIEVELDAAEMTNAVGDPHEKTTRELPHVQPRRHDTHGKS